MAQNYVATNQDYLNAYSEYLKTNNKNQATQYTQKVGDKTIPCDYDLFFDFLLNKITMSVVSNHEFIDPLSELYSGSLSVGKYIEDKRTVLIGKEKDYSVKEFEVDVTNPFAKEKRAISVVFHKVNAHKKIKITVSYDQLQEAVLNEGGINSLVDSMINDITVERDAWSYTDKKKALQSPDYTTLIEFEDYADFNIKVRNVLVDLKNFDNSYKYNSALLYSPTNLSNIYIIMSEKYKNEQDIKFFAGLFNVDYAELKKNIKYIDEFDDVDTKCMIVDKRGIFFKKTLDVTRNLPNPDDLTYNYTAHFWRMHSVSPHYSAIIVKQKNTDVVNATLDMEQSKIATSPFDVTFTIPQGYECYYTIDGSTPTKSSTKYTDKINISKSTVLKVLTVKTGKTARDDQKDIRIYRVRFV